MGKSFSIRAKGDGFTDKMAEDSTTYSNGAYYGHYNNWAEIFRENMERKYGGQWTVMVFTGEHHCHMNYVNNCWARLEDITRYVYVWKVSS